MDSEASDSNVSTRWEAEANLAAIEGRFGEMFESPGYHQALRQALSPNPAEQLASFTRASAEMQQRIVDTVYARLAQDGQLPARSERAAKDAITKHLSALPSLDRKITRKILAMPPHRTVWSRLAALLGRLRNEQPT